VRPVPAPSACGLLPARCAKRSVTPPRACEALTGTLCGRAGSGRAARCGGGCACRPPAPFAQRAFAGLARARASALPRRPAPHAARTGAGCALPGRGRARPRAAAAQGAARTRRRAAVAGRLGNAQRAGAARRLARVGARAQGPLAGSAGAPPCPAGGPAGPGSARPVSWAGHQLGANLTLPYMTRCAARAGRAGGGAADGAPARDGGGRRQPPGARLGRRGARAPPACARRPCAQRAGAAGPSGAARARAAGQAALQRHARGQR